MKTTLRASFVDYRVRDGGIPSVTLQLEGGDTLAIQGEPWMLEAMKRGDLARVTVEAVPDGDGDDDPWRVFPIMRRP